MLGSARSSCVTCNLILLFYLLFLWNSSWSPKYLAPPNVKLPSVFPLPLKLLMLLFNVSCLMIEAGIGIYRCYMTICSFLQVSFNIFFPASSSSYFYSSVRRFIMPRHRPPVPPRSLLSLPRLWAGWSRVQVPAGVWYFSLHHRVQTGSGVHPTSYPMGTRGSFPEDKAAGVWSWPLTSI
jgi:hypothetical protein